MSERVRDIAHLSHVELLTPKPAESLFYFREILGMEVSGEVGDSVYLRGFRHWIGLLAMVNDENNGRVSLDESGAESFEASFNERERARIDSALQFSRDVLSEAGATKVHWTGLITTHVQGTCRMGSDPERSAVDADAQSWDVKRLYVGDGSLIPQTLSVNPSLTIMALASRLAEHLHADPHGYLA